MNKALLSGKNMKIYRPNLNLPLITSASNNKNKMDLSSRNFTFSFKPSEWKAAITEAEKIVGYSTSFLSLRCLLSDELSNVAVHMKKLVGTSHPLIKTAQKLFQDGKQSMQTRGLMVLLISKTAGPAVGSNLLETMVSGIYPSQRTLAEITELIHMATLVHKSVIDLCNICLTSTTLEDMEFGNKMAVLSGDFLLANASTYLASLNNTKVVFLFRNESDDGSEDFIGGPKNKLKSELSMDMWEEQTYLSSGSLLAHSCQGALTLARHDPSLQTSAFQFGRSMALAFQVSFFISSLLANNFCLAKSCHIFISSKKFEY
ncbi:hypothetical protein HELRODRAFT_111519 [Helobdella robusta]|uniref:Decaprenyl-diphosphate synthase subunit 2 n=1 Tax=Helobdella robusta TaxID=6412 RepID=T1EFC0_HELRO|nr:hypothetical protein HELRODRAFT_111519 [Helobdella robusta]ESO05076.1 hypothetical protein HELRODRAFT_111519 [Helobdella robusta]